MPNAIIKNGTRSRVRNVKDTREAWDCPECGRHNAKWNGNCPSCYTKRP